MFFMRGHLHPVPDTPFNLNALAQTNRQSDVSFHNVSFKIEAIIKKDLKSCKTIYGTQVYLFYLNNNDSISL